MNINKPKPIFIRPVKFDYYISGRDEWFYYKLIDQHPNWYKVIKDQLGNEVYVENWAGEWMLNHWATNGNLINYETGKYKIK